MSETRQILEERGKRYGPFKNHADISRALKEVTLGLGRRDDGTFIPTNHLALEPYQRESLEMIFHKIARILNGDTNYDDSWKDIAGYAQLVVDILNGKNT